MMVESSEVLFSREIEDLHDDDFEGSKDEQRIFYEIFFGSDGSRKKGFMVSEATIIPYDYKKGTGMSHFSNSGKSSLTSHNDSAKKEFSGKYPLDLLSIESNHEVKPSVEDLPDVKPDLGDTLCASAPSEGVVSGISLETNPKSAGHSLTYRVVESSSQGVASVSYQLKPVLHLGKVCETSGRGSCKNRLSSLNQNDQKEAANRTVTSPISQESYASRLLATDPSQSVANKSGIHRPIKHKWKNSCFLQLDEDELAMPRDIKNDPRPLLRYHINRLLRAAGWLIGRRRRKSKYNGIGEYVYKSPGGRPIREFHRAWNMCGETLLADSNSCLLTTDSMQWTDMTELRTDLSGTIQQIDDKLDTLENTSAMANLWCLLDPFANVVFIEKKIRLLKEGITVTANRSSVIPSDAGPVAKYRKVSRSERSCVNPMPLQDWGYDESNKIDIGLFNVPISSRGPRSLGGFEAVLPHQDCSTSSPSSDQIKDKLVVVGKMKLTHKKSRKISEMKLTGTRLEHLNTDEISSVRCGSNKVKARRLNDDDLLISAIMKPKICRTTKKWSVRKSKPPKKRKTRKGSCRLLPRSLKKGAKQILDGKWSAVGSRTVLSWLIHCGVVSLSEGIQYRNENDDTMIKYGVVTRDGILCKCCNTMFSISKFKIHASSSLNCPCANLFMESGKAFTACQLEAWSGEYMARKVAPQTEQIDDTDQNDDSCGRCGDVGELICCDNCPSAFHQACLFMQELPEGNWYCPQCRCRICGDVVSDEEEFSQLHGNLKCIQCENRYHGTCMQSKGMGIGLVSGTWFCGDGCQQVYDGLQSRIGLENLLSDGFSWTLLRCIPSDHEVDSAQQDEVLRAECNSKLAVAITIMEECFLPMVDIKTGIDMIPQLIYNWGSQYARLNYSRFYTAVIEKDDVVLCVASIRIHGVVAELPLVATCSRYRRQGMCRLLINAIEEMLKSLKVEKLFISAIPDLVETWTLGFGFQPLEEDERQDLSKINLMVFPGSVWLKKLLYTNCSMDASNESCDNLPLDSIEVGENAEPSGDNLAAKQEQIGATENLEFCKGDILAILQNPPRKLCFEDQDSRPPKHHVCLEETNNVAREVHPEREKAGSGEEVDRSSLSDQPSRRDELECEQLSDSNSSPEEADAGCEVSENALHCSRKPNSVVFIDELPVTSNLCNPVLEVSDDTVQVPVPPGSKLDVGCCTEAEEIHSVRQNIVFL